MRDATVTVGKVSMRKATTGSWHACAGDSISVDTMKSTVILIALGCWIQSVLLYAVCARSSLFEIGRIEGTPQIGSAFLAPNQFVCADFTLASHI